MWLALITLLIQLFGPLLVEWLRKRLHIATDNLPAFESYPDTSAATAALFDYARQSLPRYAVIRRGFVLLLRGIALRRAEQLHAVMHNVPGAVVTPLNGDERDECGVWVKHIGREQEPGEE